MRLPTKNTNMPILMQPSDHKAPEEEDEEDVISGIHNDFALSLSLSRTLVRLSLSFSNCFSFCLASLIRV